MNPFKTITIQQSVFANNDKQADELRKDLKNDQVFLLNLMASPGAGKTTTLTQTINRLKDQLKIGVMEADIDSDVDAQTISQTGVVSAIIGNNTVSTQLGTIELATFINNSGLIAIGRNLFRETEASGTATLGTPGTNGIGTLLQGSVENSNVNLVEELTHMITAQRAFEINSKVISTSDQMMQTANQMK
jgi:flagellar hook-basal body protein